MMQFCRSNLSAQRLVPTLKAFASSTRESFAGNLVMRIEESMRDPYLWGTTFRMIAYGKTTKKISHKIKAVFPRPNNEQRLLKKPPCLSLSSPRASTAKPFSRTRGSSSIIDLFFKLTLSIIATIRILTSNHSFQLYFTSNFHSTLQFLGLHVYDVSCVNRRWSPWSTA